MATQDAREEFDEESDRAIIHFAFWGAADGMLEAAGAFVGIGEQHPLDIPNEITKAQLALLLAAVNAVNALTQSFLPNWPGECKPRLVNTNELEELTA